MIYLQKLPEYAVEITETFQKTVKVKAGSESYAMEIVRR
ncbi:MAG: DpnD/PcfM family protein [Anaerovoracaceae bacterium]